MFGFSYVSLVFYLFLALFENSPNFPPLPSRSRQTTIVNPSVIVAIEKVAYGGIIIVAHLGYLELRIDSNLEYIRATWQLCNVHPLAVEIV